jgi:hypothetical protein
MTSDRHSGPDATAGVFSPSQYSQHVLQLAFESTAGATQHNSMPGAVFPGTSEEAIRQAPITSGGYWSVQGADEGYQVSYSTQQRPRDVIDAFIEDPDFDLEKYFASQSGAATQQSLVPGSG